MRRTVYSIHKVLGIVLCAIVILLSFSNTLWADGGGRRSMEFFEVFLLPRVWVGAVFCLIGMGLMVKSWVHRRLRLIMLGTIFSFFGILPVLPLGRFAWGMGLHPSPVCAITKPFLFLNAGRPVPVIFLAIVVFISMFSIIGNKLFCGWACPIGAIQEAFNHFSLSRKFKFVLPFKATNTVRIIISIAFFTFVFITGLSLYDYLNPFHFLHWRFETTSIVALLITLMASVFFFRPFCHMVCPIGLFTWVLERFSLVKIKVNRNTCKDCKLCMKKSSCPAVESILEERKYRPDCFACGRCIEMCPEKALGFSR